MSKFKVGDLVCLGLNTNLKMSVQKIEGENVTVLYQNTKGGTFESQVFHQDLLEPFVSDQGSLQWITED